jgi:hypothetical protein
MTDANPFVPTYQNLLAILKDHYDRRIEDRILTIYTWGSRYLPMIFISQSQEFTELHLLHPTTTLW